MQETQTRAQSSHARGGEKWEEMENIEKAKKKSNTKPVSVHKIQRQRFTLND